CCFAFWFLCCLFFCLFPCFAFCFGWFDWFFFVSIFSLPLVFVSCFCLVFTSSFSFISSVKIDIWFDILKFSACNLLITSLDVIFCSLAYSLILNLLIWSPPHYYFNRD